MTDVASEGKIVQRVIVLMKFYSKKKANYGTKDNCKVIFMPWGIPQVAVLAWFGDAKGCIEFFVAVV